MSLGAEKGSGFIAISELEIARLYQDDFLVGSETVLHIDAIAAFEDKGEGAPLVIYPWIVNRDTDVVLWRPRGTAIKREGVLATITDSVVAPAGSYTSYYSTYGPSRNSRKGGSFLGLKPHWTNNTKIWALNISSASPGGAIRSEKLIVEETSEPGSPDIIWSYSPHRAGDSGNRMIHVRSSTRLHIEATTAVCSGGCGSVQLLKVPSGDVIWEIALGNTSAAGGAEINRTFSGTIDVEPGLYRIIFDSGRQHTSQNWTANPPWLPYRWGLRISAADAPQAYAFDPWSGAEPLVAMLKVEDDADLSITLELDEPMDVIAFAMGEMESVSARYDYGWIERYGVGEIVWEMSYEKTSPAGGNEMNRQEMAILSLDPGKYIIRYVSDGSHSYQDWNKSRPEHPERWGLALFPMDPASLNKDAVRVQARRDVWDTGVPQAEGGENMAFEFREILVQHIEMGNDASFTERFKLDSPSVLKIVALGEITHSAQYDYGWIDRVPSHDRVWEMTFQNTVFAGGDDRNRRFTGTISLEAGEYEVHFQTDMSHGYGDFYDEPPKRAEDWGLTIYKANE